MDIYTVIARVTVESLAIANGMLGSIVNMPANATGPLDTNITITSSGLQFVDRIAGAAVGAASIMCDMFGALFP
jgi:hypothetical protein